LDNGFPKTDLGQQSDKVQLKSKKEENKPKEEDFDTMNFDFEVRIVEKNFNEEAQKS
jgi:hypothetical protein